ncbi:MAG: type VII toxin-antitoxin system HepT family RNase toxin [Halomonas sp.]
MEDEYIDAMREHFATLAEELEQLHQAALSPQGLNVLLHRAAERNLQLLTEACIGITKQRLKALGSVVPSDARKAFEKLRHLGYDDSDIPRNKVIGLRNALVHDYLNLDDTIVEGIIRRQEYQQLLTFAEQQLADAPPSSTPGLSPGS